MFCWAVKSGQYKRDFCIIKSDGQLNITKSNFTLVRPTFGEWAAKAVASFGQKSLHLVPVPNTEALSNVTTYRTLTMVEESFRNTEYADRALDGLRWKKQRQKAHEGGSRKREELLPLLSAKPEVKGKKVILIDENGDNRRKFVGVRRQIKFRWSNGHRCRYLRTVGIRYR